MLLLQIQFAQKTDKVGKRVSQQSDGKIGGVWKSKGKRVSQQSDDKIGSWKGVEREKLERVELVGDEKEKKVLHGKVELHELKMKERVKQLKSLSYMNQKNYFGGVPQMLVSCPIRLIITQTQKKYCTTICYPNVDLVSTAGPQTPSKAWLTRIISPKKRKW